MQTDTFALVLKTLFKLACEEAGLPRLVRSAQASIRGHRFEDAAAKAAYEALVHVGVTPRQPRRTLALPTVSGLQHQLDVVVPEGSRWFIIELKHRSSAQIEQLYAFVAKLLDYALAARLHRTGHEFTGVFVSTAPRLNDHFRQFALAYGVVVIAPDLPPCQVLEECPEDESVRRDALDLAGRLEVPLPTVAIRYSPSVEAALLVQEWRALAQRWAQRCASSRP